MQARLVVQKLCRIYMSSYPGADNAGPNVALHRSIRQLIEGTKLPSYKVEELRSILTFRMELTKVRANYKNITGLNFADYHGLDVESWTTKNRPLDT